MTEYGSISSLINQTALLLNETRQFQDDPDTDAVLVEGIGVLRMLRRRLDASEKKYAVAVVGLSNVGKSTLLNALFGMEIAPRRNGPCTAVPIQFRHGTAWRIAVLHEQSMYRPTWDCQNLPGMHAKLSELGSGADMEAGKGIRLIEVEAPLALLDGGLIICDTPGFGAAQTGEAEGEHERRLKLYLTSDVAQVFWVVSAEQAIGKTEMEFHNRFFADVCDDVVVTNCDSEGELWDEGDRTRFRNRYASRFGHRLPNFHFVSGALGYSARTEGDADKLDEAGIPALEKRIRKLSNAAGRVQELRESLRSLLVDLAQWLEYRESSHPYNYPRWRPDSLARWKTIAESFPEYSREICRFIGDTAYSFPTPSRPAVRDISGTSVQTSESTVTRISAPAHEPQKTRPPLSSPKRVGRQIAVTEAQRRKGYRKASAGVSLMVILVTIAAKAIINAKEVSTIDFGELDNASSVLLLGFGCLLVLSGSWFGWTMERMKVRTSNWLKSLVTAFALFVVSGGILFVVRELPDMPVGFIAEVLSAIIVLCYAVILVVAGMLPGIAIPPLIRLLHARRN